MVGADECRDLDRALSLEWLETNGRGGFASGTVAGAKAGFAYTRAEVSAEFDAPASLRPWLAEAGFDGDDAGTLLRSWPTMVAAAEAIRTSGVAIPGDIVIADDDGVVVVPQQMAAIVADYTLDHEEWEVFSRIKLAEGGALRKYYPLNEEGQREYEEWRKGSQI